VKAYDYSEFGKAGDCWQSAEFSVTGEAGGRWYEFKAYGISIEEAIDDHDKIAESLIGAWNGLAR
jgi:hypothetical protein